MKKANTPHAAGANSQKFGSRAVFVKIILQLIVVATILSGGGAAYGNQMFEASQSVSTTTKPLKQNLFVPALSADPFFSSLIVQIGFNPISQPASFEVGVSNPLSQPLRIQTQNISGAAQTVGGAGFTVFINVTTTSPTGRFDLSPTGGFTTNSLIVTVTSGRSDSQSFYYRDTTPGTVVLTGTVTSVANTGLTFGETASITKSVIAVGENKLSFGTQPANTKKDSTIVPPIKVRVEDSAGNLITNSTRNITLSIGNNPAGGNLSGTTTVPAVGGVATFNNLKIDKAGNGYSLLATAPSPVPALVSATSSAFNIDKLDQSIDFGELDDKTYGDDDFDIQATSSAGSDVSFASLTEQTCNIGDRTVVIVAAGVCTIRASLAGDSDHNPADDVDRSFTIHKANATISVTPYDVVYNGESHIATLVSIAGVKGETGDEVGSVDLNGTSHINAGVYNDVWLFLGSENYNDTSGSIENHISKALVTANAGGGTSTYDGNAKTPSPCVISGNGYVGDLSCSNDPETVGPDAGSYSISSGVIGTGLSNFDIASVGGSYTIEKAPTAVSVTFEPGPHVYRGSAFSAAAKVTGAGGFDQSISQIAYSGDCLNATAANGCSALASYPESANHLGGSGNASITIAKKLLNVTASSHVLNFGDAAPNITAAFDGFVPGEDSSVIDLLPTCFTTYAAGSPIGIYPTGCSGGLDNNYAFASPYIAGAVIVNSVCSSFNGFQAPVGGANAYPSMSGPGGSFNSPLRTFKLNSTIPFKFTATCHGAPLTSGVHTLTAQKYSNGVPVGDELITLADDSSTPDNLFRFSEGQWQFNFKTKDLGDSAQGTWLFEATLFDGSKYGVWLAIRK